MNNFRGGMYPDGYVQQMYQTGNNYVNQWPSGQAMFRPAPQNYPMIVGKVVGNLDDIRPNEVPNDGSISVFPQFDGECIYVKYLSADGRINTVKYERESQEVPNVNQNGMGGDYTVLDGRLAKIEERLDQLLSRGYPRRNKPYYKKGKEGNVNEPVGNEQPDDCEHG